MEGRPDEVPTMSARVDPRGSQEPLGFLHGEPTQDDRAQGRTQAEDTPRFIYIAKTADGYVKIGISTNVDQRLLELRNTIGTKAPASICKPVQFTALTVVPGSFSEESSLHEYFADERVNGCAEWFFGESVDAYLYDLLQMSDDERLEIVRTTVETVRARRLVPKRTFDCPHCHKCIDPAVLAEDDRRRIIGVLSRSLRTQRPAGRKPNLLIERCPCGANTIKRARARSFQCCKQAIAAGNLEPTLLEDTTMKHGIGYTIVGTVYRLVRVPSFRAVDNRMWDLTDAGEKAAEQAARETAAKLKVKYRGYEK